MQEPRAKGFYIAIPPSFRNGDTFHVNEDGGWGMHLGGDTTVFATAIYYVVFRILRMEPKQSFGSSISRAATCPG